MIKLGMVETGKIAFSFFDKFLFREYDLDKNEFFFYLALNQYKEDIITEINNQII